MDIVESLRKYQCPENKGCNTLVECCQCDLMDSGADEIERLREALQSIRKVPNSEAAYGIIQVFVDDALKGDE